jgi:hypothetical protein
MRTPVIDAPTPSELLQAELEPLPTGNTLCPKIGAAQWTCTFDECTCHLKESIRRRQRATLADEIEEARARLAALEHRALSATCAELGHKMKCTGGANCGCEDGSCSIPVNTCERCGDCDYGDNDEAREVIARCHT